MDEPTRKAGVEWAMGVLLARLQAEGLLPAVLIAVPPGGGPPAVMACGPGVSPESLRALVRAAADADWELPDGSPMS